MKIVEADPLVDLTRKRAWVTIGYFATFVALGFPTASLGPSLSRLAENTHTHFGAISFLFTTRALGYMLGSLLGGSIFDRLPGNPILGLALFLVALGLGIVPTLSLLWALSIVMFLMGIVGGTIDVGGNTLLVWLHGKKVGPYMNALHFFFGLGALLSPIIIAQALARTDDIAWGYWGLALLVLPIALSVWRLPSPVAQSKRAGTVARPRQSGLAALLAIFFFFFVAGEISFEGWIATYIVAQGLGSEVDGANMTAVFWVSLAIGRLLSIPIARRFSFRAILLSDIVGCLVSMGVILLWPERLVAIWAGTIGVGFSMASMFPISISLAERHMTVTGRITSWFLIGAASGGMIVPWLIGQMFVSAGPQVVIWAILSVFVIALGILFLLIRRIKQISVGLNDGIVV